MMTIREELAIDFGAQKGGEAFCTSGWSTPEPTERWTTGRESVLVLPAPTRAATYVMALRLRPMLAPPQLTAQRLRMSVNGVDVASFTIDRRTQRACRVPWQAIDGRSEVQVTLHLPEAARPSDFSANSNDRRQLGVALERLQFYPDTHVAGPTDAFLSDESPVRVDADAVMAVDRMALHDLMLRFESLGQNCEFGLVQRQCQAEPLGLLRFSSTPLPQLLNALDARFEGMGKPGSIAVTLSNNGREYMVNDQTYGFLYHAWVNAGEMAPDDVMKREARRVPFLVRKLLEDLEAGDKTFVFKGMGAIPEEEVFPLATALRRYGPSTLLFVTLADAEHRSGSVVARAPGFLVGYVDRFAPGENAHDLSLAEWVKVCREAQRMRIASGG